MSTDAIYCKDCATPRPSPSKTDKFLLLWSGNTGGLISFARGLEAENNELLSALKDALPLLQDHQNQCRSVRAAGLFLRVRALLEKQEAKP